MLVLKALLDCTIMQQQSNITTPLDLTEQEIIISYKSRSSKLAVVGPSLAFSCLSDRLKCAYAPESPACVSVIEWLWELIFRTGNWDFKLLDLVWIVLLGPVFQELNANSSLVLFFGCTVNVGCPENF